MGASTNQDGKTTVSGSGTVKTKTGLDVGVNVSTSSDGTKKGGVSVSTSVGGTTLKTGATGSNNGNKSSVEFNIGVEQKVKDTKVTQSFFIKAGN